eukprot:TRINITY_DN5985_c0_g1_i1.p1 TRINITY_DN5985_c0_g1~~TRINITY_DN5985_c0_g1_i1.p1  ORF type:complete len:753 (-),score=149.75 TRINITY_DN5985_c0_g1_i1:91-2349(-)
MSSSSSSSLNSDKDYLLLDSDELDAIGWSFTKKKINQSLETFQELIGTIGLSESTQSTLNNKLVDLHDDILRDLDASIRGLRDTVQIQVNFQLARNNYINSGLNVICDEFKGKELPEAVKIFRAAQQLNDLDTNVVPQNPKLTVESVDEEPFSLIKRYHPKSWTKERFRYYFLKRFSLYGFIKNYRRYDIFYDMFAAITVLCTVIPQGIGYALLAGLPPIYGLYAAFVPPIVYTFFGSSKELCVGPVSMISIIIFDSLSDDLVPQTDYFIEAALFIAFLAGMFLLAARILQIGFLIENLLSLPVLSGFTCAAGLLILLSQIKNLLRLTGMGNATTIIDYGEQFRDHLHEWHNWSLLLGSLTLITLLLMKNLWKNFPMVFLIVIFTTATMYITDAYHKAGILILQKYGSIPSGLPDFKSPFISSDNPISTSNLIESALIVGLVGYMESISVSKKFAAKNHYRIHLSNELMALSMSTLAGSFFQAYPTTGSLSRTALKFQCGSKSPFSSLLSGVIMGGVLLWATHLFEYVALPVISAIVISAVTTLLDWEEPYFLWKVDKLELIPYLITFGATLLLGPEIGVVIAVIMSMFQVLWRTAHPRIVLLGRIPGTQAYRDTNRFPSAQTFPGVLIIRLDARLYFANITRFRDKIERFMRRSPTPVRHIVLDASGVNSIDASAVFFLYEFLAILKKKRIEFMWASVKGPVRDFMTEVGLTDVIGRQHFFLNVHDVITYIQNGKSKSQLLQKGSKADLTA